MKTKAPGSRCDVAEVEVYFDDFKVTQVKSPVVQTDDYYPFGLTFNSYSRENSLFNKHQYNGKELQVDLGLNWLDYGWRIYNPDLGRWNRNDDKSDKYYSFSTYSYAVNNPLLFIDPSGNEIVVIGDDKYRAAVRQALLDLSKTPEGSRLVEYLTKSEHVTVIHQRLPRYPGGNPNKRYQQGTTTNGRSGSWISFDPNYITKGTGAPGIPYVSLGHELRHAEQDTEDNPNWKQNAAGDYPTAEVPGSNGEHVPLAEIDGVNSENKIRAGVPGGGTRTIYDGVNVKDLVIDGKSFKVQATDLKSYTGQAAKDKFLQILKSVNSPTTTGNLDQYKKRDKIGTYNHKYNKGDKAAVID